MRPVKSRPPTNNEINKEKVLNGDICVATRIFGNRRVKVYRKKRGLEYRGYMHGLNQYSVLQRRAWSREFKRSNMP